MEIGLFGLMALLGFMLFFEGFSKKNPFLAWAGAIILMFSGTEILLNGVLYPSGAIIWENSTNMTQIVNTYVVRNDWFIMSLGRLLFWVGWFGLFFPVVDFSGKKDDPEKERGEID